MPKPHPELAAALSAMLDRIDAYHVGHTVWVSGTIERVCESLV